MALGRKKGRKQADTQKQKKYISISLRKRTSFGKPAKRVTNTFLGNARGKRGSGAFPLNKLKKHHFLSLPLPFFGGGTTWRIRVRARKVWCFLNQEGPLLRVWKPEGPRRLADIPQLEYCSALPSRRKPLKMRGVSNPEILPVSHKGDHRLGNDGQRGEVMRR